MFIDLHFAWICYLFTTFFVLSHFALLLVFDVVVFYGLSHCCFRFWTSAETFCWRWKWNIFFRNVFLSLRLRPTLDVGAMKQIAEVFECLSFESTTIPKYHAQMFSYKLLFCFFFYWSYYYYLRYIFSLNTSPRKLLNERAFSFRISRSLSFIQILFRSDYTKNVIGSSWTIHAGSFSLFFSVIFEGLFNFQLNSFRINQIIERLFDCIFWIQSEMIFTFCPGIEIQFQWIISYWERYM